jgi:hypothetical protein
MFLISCKKKSVSGKLIITQVPGTMRNYNFNSGDSWRYLPEARIAALDPDDPSSLDVLTDDFYSACFPDISYDGKNMLFAAQQNQGDQWQIWEMNLNNRKYRNVISCDDNCADPVYLPGGRMVFSKLTINDTIRSGHALYTCNLDGSSLKQITFHPGSNFASTVLKDGRLLTICKLLLPEPENQMLMVMRPDGTKADMFYKSAPDFVNTCRARETSDGKIVFVEALSDKELSGDLVSIKYNRPLHSRENLTTEIDGSFNSVFPFQKDKLLVSYRNSPEERYALCEFDTEKKSLGRTLYQDKDYDIMDINAASKYERPKKLPSEVDLHVKTGLLLCQDINFMGLQDSLRKPAVPVASMIEILGIDSTYGVVKVEKDGSFYLKVLADTPFRIRTLDDNGHVIHGPCSWLWLRPNERRGCVGCHEDPELVPANRIPIAVRSDPKIIPVHITSIKDKTVELE